VAPPLGGVMSRNARWPGLDGRVKIPCALSCKSSPMPSGVEVAKGEQAGVGDGVGVLVEAGVFVGDPFGVGVTVPTGVPVGGAPKHTLTPTSTVGVGVGLELLLPPPQLNKITEPRNNTTGARTNNRRGQNIAH
jgi:hypothetical protein